MIKYFPLTLLFAVLVFAACEDAYLFNEKKEISGGRWAYADSLSYKIAIADTAALYNLYIVFEHADTFPTQNLYLKLHTRFPDGKTVQKQRSFEFFDFEGKPFGKCSGNQCTVKTLLQNNLYFNQVGDYVIGLEQFTRIDPLPGITSISLMLEKTEQKR